MEKIIHVLERADQYPFDGTFDRQERESYNKNMNAPAAKPPVRRSKTIAKIYPERCTGCEACIAVAPWDTCILKNDHDLNKPFGMTLCEVQPDVCTGCTLCMKICPWDAIEMVPRPGYTPPAPAKPKA